MTHSSDLFQHLSLQQQSTKSLSHFTDANPHLFCLLSNDEQALFIRALGLSDFILRSALQEPLRVIELFKQDVHLSNDHIPDYLLQLNDVLSQISSEEELHTALRRFRLEAMVQIACCDLVLDHPLTVSLTRLSNLADALIIGARDWLTQFCQQRWGVPTSHNGEQQTLLVYGMGKLGGQELNFSSDIDLIFTYPESGETVGARKSLDNQQFFTRLGQKLITALNNQSADGFVYRVDMRLRPFGESGPLVMSFNALEDYYQEQGRDWERYAMLKARLVGKSQFNDQLGSLLKPFVYRRYIDFSVIESLRKMKMMISQEVRRKQLRNNIKLGAGGIREIEFIVQVFQLIRGGRLKELQCRHLLSVLPVLVDQEIVSQSSADVLRSAYLFLRRVENIIQAIDDKQTQTLPDNELDQQRLIDVLNIVDWPTFLAITNEHMTGVHQEFKALIGEENPNHQSVDEQWSLLWLSQWDEEDSTECLAQLAPDWSHHNIWQVIRDFRVEVQKRSIGNRGRQVLDKLMPLLLMHLNKAEYDHHVLSRILAVLTKVLTRTAYLELLLENEGALVHLIKLCYMSEWLAEHIAKFPMLLDELIDPKLLHNPPALSAYQDELHQIMLRVPEDDVELQMDALRQFKQAQQLRIAAADIVGVLPVMKVSDHLTALAQAIISEVVNQAWHQLLPRFGQPNSTVGTDYKGFAVIGYGKMGGVELSYSSDLDLVFLHESSSDDTTNGNKQIPASQFYLKLAQKVMHLFNTRMASGILYELDMRLRPSGHSGVLTIHVDAFDEYQNKDAWTWEHQALVRARMVFGHSSLLEQFKQSRRHVLSTVREQSKLQGDVLNMRNKMRAHLDKSTNQLIDIKQGAGGLVDIEFMVQYLVLQYSHQYPILCQFSDNVSIISQLEKLSLLTHEQGGILTQAYQALRSFGHRQALKNESALMEQDKFNQYANKVADMWNECFNLNDG